MCDKMSLSIIAGFLRDVMNTSASGFGVLGVRKLSVLLCVVWVTVKTSASGFGVLEVTRASV